MAPEGTVQAALELLRTKAPLGWGAEELVDGPGQQRPVVGLWDPAEGLVQLERLVLGQPARCESGHRAEWAG